VVGEREVSTTQEAYDYVVVRLGEDLFALWSEGSVSFLDILILLFLVAFCLEQAS